MTVQALICNLEAVMIAAGRPQHNGIAGDFANIEKYEQVRDERLGQLGTTPPDPKKEPVDDKDKEDVSEAAEELADIKQTEVTVGNSRWKLWAVGAFSVVGWLLALLLILANKV